MLFLLSFCSVDTLGFGDTYCSGVSPVIDQCGVLVTRAVKPPTGEFVSDIHTQGRWGLVYYVFSSFPPAAFFFVRQ